MEPFAKWNPNRDCWESTDSIDLLSEHLDVYSETFPTSGMTRNGLAYELPMPELHTVDSGSSFLPTPTVDDAGNLSRESGSFQSLTRSVNQLLPTPAANDSGNTPENHLRKKPGRQVVTSLMVMADYGLIATGGHLLPTPVASEGTKATTLQGSAEKALTGQVWLTNVAHDLAQLNGDRTGPRSNSGNPSLGV